MQTESRYSGISILNHWITALLVIAMLTLGFVGGAAPNDDMEHYVMGVHVALGFFVLLFVLWRVGFRLYTVFPPNLGASPLERGMAYLVHRLILLTLTLQVLTGPLYLFTEGEGMNVFGWFTFYIPLESLSAIHEPMEEIHVVLGVYVLPVLLVLHLLGAAVHYLRDHRTSPADM
jgi:cytochrome b561